MLQIVVYAGAIMVLFLFVLMLLNVKEEQRVAGGGRAFRWAALGLGALLAVQLAVVVVRAAREGAGLGGRLRRLRAQRWRSVLFSAPYLYVFEATSVLIVAALVGAMALARKRPRP